MKKGRRIARNLNGESGDSRANLAQHVRDLYVDGYRIARNSPNYGTKKLRWDERTSKTSRNYRSIWPKLAKRFRKEQIDPAVYIPWLFTTGTVPVPSKLFTPENLKRFRNHRDPNLMQERAKLEFEVDLVQFQRSLVPKLDRYYGPDAVQLALEDEDVNKATPLFRFCFGALYGLPDICSRYLAAAKSQYMENRQAYDQLWDGRLLAALRMQNG